MTVRVDARRIRLRAELHQARRSAADAEQRRHDTWRELHRLRDPQGGMLHAVLSSAGIYEPTVEQVEATREVYHSDYRPSSWFGLCDAVRARLGLAPIDREARKSKGQRLKAALQED